VEHAHKHKAWVVMDSRYTEMLRCNTSSEAYAWRNVLAEKAKRAGRLDTGYTVSYLPSPFAIKSQTILGENGARISYIHRRK
jgi:hypothetical protein